jgi:urease accessory protein
MDAFLLQLADSAFPTGGYAFSNGLEAAWQAGLLRARDGFESWLDAVCPAYAAWELPFVSSVWGRKLADSQRTFLVYDAQAMPATARSASLRLGGTWARVLASLDPLAKEWEDDLRARKLPTHQVLVVASALSLFSVDLAQARLFALWMFLRDQISSGVRLGILGPMEAASIHHHRLRHLEQLAISAPDRIEDAHRSAPLWDLAQGLHHKLYSRLFQS